MRKDDGNGSTDDEGKSREAIEIIIEQEKKLMEEMPDFQLQDKIKSVRQVYFKANYKKRKLMGMMASSSKSSSNSSPLRVEAVMDYRTKDEADEMKSLLSDSFSSTNIML